MNLNFAEGQVILIDKPRTWTSFDIVKKIRYAIKTKKIGHAGTLDPLATGLMILCTGKFTKKIDEYQGQEKTYTGKMVLGQLTPSLDLETDVSKEMPWEHVTAEAISEKVKELTGDISQVPPIYSALKIDGKRLYKMARKGKTEVEVEIKPRDVTVHEFTITDISLPELSFKIRCSKGTYIRSLVRDLGEKLGTVATMTALRRTQIGNFSLDDALEPLAFIELVKQAEAAYALANPSTEEEHQG